MTAKAKLKEFLASLPGAIPATSEELARYDWLVIEERREVLEGQINLLKEEIVAIRNAAIVRAVGKGFALDAALMTRALGLRTTPTGLKGKPGPTRKLEGDVRWLREYRSTRQRGTPAERKAFGIFTAVDVDQAGRRYNAALKEVALREKIIES